MLLLAYALVPFGLGARQAEVPVVPLTRGWELRAGDSPLHAAGFPLWTVPGDSGWQPLDRLAQPVRGTGHHYLWLRVRLPAQNWAQPTLYLPAVHQAVQVYVDTEMIYQAGTLNSAGNNKTIASMPHLIALKRSAPGKMLYLRLFSEEPGTIGVMDVGDQVLIGEQFDLLKFIFMHDADTIFLGFLFMIIGGFALFIYFRRFREREFHVFSFGLFALLAGLFYVLQDRSTALVFSYPEVRYYLSFATFLLFPVPMYAFFEQAIPSDDCRIIRQLWKLHLAAAVTFILLDYFDGLHFHSGLRLFFVVFIVTICVMFVISYRATQKGSWQARMFIYGFVLMGVTGLNDLLIGLRVVPYWHWIAHWGMFGFILMLGYILERQFAENHSRLEAYSRKLEFQARKLDKYSQILEQKVAERTRDLNEKNQQLENTLRQLTAMQNQLITQAKLASLGKLVAAVAHEVNNPIGAVRSAADVSARCLRQIDAALRNGRETPPEPPRTRKALDMLRENIRVILKGSERITAIIHNLKNFVHLDEAAYQQIDLRKGIENTLAMLRGDLPERITIEKKLGEIPPVFCYPGELNQVFLNIVQNAIQAIDGSGKIVIQTRTRGPAVEVEIQDSGRGIPAGELDHIFEIGFSGKSSRMQVGAGLFTAYNIVQKHGGRIEIDSEVGRGTRVLLRLPVRSQPEAERMGQDA